MMEFTGHIYDKPPWYKLFVDDIVSVDESSVEMILNLNYSDAF